MAELKFVITGTAGVGKTTALRAICDKPPIETDALTTDELASVKDTTTVAFDFGEVILDADTVVRVYGTPGQERFRHMWEIVSEGALGLVILVDNSRPNPLEDLKIYLNNFQTLISEAGAVIGVTRYTDSDATSLDDYCNFLGEQELYLPVLEADPRVKGDIINLMDALMAMVECA